MACVAQTKARQISSRLAMFFVVSTALLQPSTVWAKSAAEWRLEFENEFAKTPRDSVQALEQSLNSLRNQNLRDPVFGAAMTAWTLEKLEAMPVMMTEADFRVASWFCQGVDGRTALLRLAIKKNPDMAAKHLYAARILAREWGKNPEGVEVVDKFLETLPFPGDRDSKLKRIMADALSDKVPENTFPERSTVAFILAQDYVRQPAQWKLEMAFKPNTRLSETYGNSVHELVVNASRQNPREQAQLDPFAYPNRNPKLVKTSEALRARFAQVAQLPTDQFHKAWNQELEDATSFEMTGKVPVEYFRFGAGGNRIFQESLLAFLQTDAQPITAANFDAIFRMTASLADPAAQFTMFKSYVEKVASSSTSLLQIRICLRAISEVVRSNFNYSVYIPTTDNLMPGAKSRLLDLKVSLVNAVNAQTKNTGDKLPLAILAAALTKEGMMPSGIDRRYVYLGLAEMVLDGISGVQDPSLIAILRIMNKQPFESRYGKEVLDQYLIGQNVSACNRLDGIPRINRTVS